jgi:hypothetical protein
MNRLVALLAIAVPAVARAATGASTGIAVDRFVPGVGPAVLLGSEGAETTPRGQVAWAASLGLVRDPLQIQVSGPATVVSHPVRWQLGTDLSVEAGVWRRLALAVGMPAVLYAAGDRLRGTGVDEQPLRSAAGGDLRLRAKVALLGDSARPGLHAALALTVTIPTGGQHDFAATDGVTVWPQLIVDARMWHRLALGVTLGARFAPVGDRQLFGTRFGDELTWSVGAIVVLGARGRWRGSLLGEAAGAVGPSDGTRPVELRGGVRIGWRSLAVDVGAGAGVDADVAAPSWRLFVVARSVIGRAR